MRALSTLLDYFVVTLLIIFPCWKIFRRVGLNPAVMKLVVKRRECRKLVGTNSW